MASHAKLNDGYAVPRIRKRPEYDILHFISSAVSPIEAVGGEQLGEEATAGRF